jgi:hypothetical protein
MFVTGPQVAMVVRSSAIGFAAYRDFGAARSNDPLLLVGAIERTWGDRSVFFWCAKWLNFDAGRRLPYFRYEVGDRLPTIPTE